MKTHAVLKMYFDRKKKSSPGFSMRALSRRLKISAPFLSRMLNGKKAIPQNLIIPLTKALDVEPELAAGMLKEHPVKKEKPTINSAYSDWDVAEDQVMQILRNWYYPSIIEVTTLNNFDGSAKEIAERLGLSLTTTQIALRELESLGVIQHKDGRYQKNKNKFRLTSAKSTPTIRKFHDEMLDKARQQLKKETSDEAFQRRLITGITLTASEEKIQEAKKKLADFLYELANELIASPGTDVYHLSTQLFPLTKRKSQS